MLALPAAVGLATLAVPLTATLFQTGKFTAHDVMMSAQPLIAYSLGLIGIILVKILTPAFFAKQDIKTPVKIALGVLVATQVMNAIFVPYLQVAGLALSIGLAACLNASFLFWSLRRKSIYTPQVGWLTFLLKVAIGLLVMAGIGIGLSNLVTWTVMQAQPILRYTYLFLTIGICMAVYFGSLFVMGFRLKDFKRVSV